MKILRKIAPLFLIPLMLFASIGFTLDVHFCGDEVKSMGIFGATPCEMEADMNQTVDLSTLPPCHQKMMMANQSENKNGFNQTKCCHNESFNFESSSELPTLAEKNISITQLNAILVYSAIHFGILKPIVQPKSYTNYRPPLIDQDISVLHQVFRI